MAPRTKTPPFATTWWSKRWWDTLANSMDKGRLDRGRRYFLNRHLMEMSYSPRAHRIDAVVEGSYSPYDVTLQLSQAEPSSAKRFLNRLLEDTVVLGRLAERTLDDRVLTYAQEEGFDLFPERPFVRGSRCDCPDSTVPCKHMATVMAALCQLAETDPTMLLRFRGVEVEPLIEAMDALQVRLENAKEEGASDPDTVTETDAGEEVTWTLSPQAGAVLDAFEADQELARDARPSLIQLIRALPLYLIKPLDERLYKRLSVGSPTGFNRARYQTLMAHYRLQAKAHLDGALSRDPLDAPYAVGVFVDEDRFRATLKHGATRSRMTPAAKELIGLHPERATNLGPQALVWCAFLFVALSLVEKGRVRPRLVSPLAPGALSVRWEPMVEDDVLTALYTALVPLLGRVGVESALVAPGLEMDGDLPVLDGIVPLSFLVPDWVEKAVSATLSVALDTVMEALPPPTIKRQETKRWKALFTGGEVAESRADAESVERFFEPLFYDPKWGPYRPVVTVRRIKGGQVSLNVGILKYEANAPQGRPILLKTVLTDNRYEAFRFLAVRWFEQLFEVTPQLERVVKENGKPVSIPADELPDFLFEACPVLESAGVIVMLPEALRRILRPSLSALLQADGALSGERTGNGVVTLNNLLSFEWTPKIGADTLSPAALEALSEQAGQIIEWREDFVYLDPKALEAIQKALKEKPSGFDKVRAALAGDIHGIPVTMNDDLKAEMDRLRAVETLKVPESITATLRPYQVRGYSWLKKNLNLGLGALMADDMGLGKTLQVITALAALKEEGKFAEKRALVVVPTSLLTNWRRELAKFAPGLNVATYYGTDRQTVLKDLSEESEDATRTDIVLTSYGLLQRDAKELQTLPWSVLVLDEAQGLKNPDTRTYAAVKSFTGVQVIGMSGTPVENRLRDYWSILSVTEPGLLGSLAHFNEEFANPIQTEHDPEALARFKRVTAPFMLRRLKTDKTIVPDLPDKVVEDRFVPLTDEQGALYAHEVAQSLTLIRELEAKVMAGEDASALKRARQGMVFSLMTKLKQICNSASQYLKRDAEGVDSGKGAQLLDIAQTVLDNEEKLLVFTQYRETGERLQKWLGTLTGTEPAFLHGGVSVKGRQKMVDDFQTDENTRILIISLKAGGTGLNLTAASVVVHYDLWWNPAVENQATDRAYRIGQHKNVQVIRLITENTFEEKVDQLLKEKLALQDDTVQTGETWVGDLEADDLAALLGSGR